VPKGGKRVGDRLSGRAYYDVIKGGIAGIGLESWIVAVNTPLSDKVSRYTLKACDWKELLKLIERIRTRVAGELKKRVNVASCYEAGYDGFWLHRLLDPASVQVDRRARRAKTDRVDVERLLRSLMAYLRGEPKVWSVVRVPSVAEEDDRRLHREGGRLICERILAPDGAILKDLIIAGERTVTDSKVDV
jgi:transposase